MAKDEFAGIIANIEKLQEQMDLAPDILAPMLLDATLIVSPTPAWNTGRLRTSGTAYVDGRKVAQNKLHGPNPNGLFDKFGIQGKSGGMVTRKETVTGGTFGADALGAVGGKVKGTISIVYRAPTAAMMHEWPGRFSDPTAGPHYITSKFNLWNLAYIQVMKRIWS
jgi:hypothetical protein